MNNNEKAISDYIDKLNSEKKPREHELADNSTEMEKLMETVRQVRSLREPVLPQNGYVKSLAEKVASGFKSGIPDGAGEKAPTIQPHTDLHLLKTSDSGKCLNQNTKKRMSKTHTVSRLKARIVGVGIAAAVVIIAMLMINFIYPLFNGNIVHAMEEAYQKISAYHGLLEISETNAQGNTLNHTKLEIWADRNGHYVVKGVEGLQKGQIIVNNGQKKWQIHPDEKNVYIFEAFPDPYRFVFEIGKEIDQAKNALQVKNIGNDIISGRKTEVLEVTPEGGLPYRIWIDTETKLPLQKQTAMQNALQHTVVYTSIDFMDSIPPELISADFPKDYKVIETYSEQSVSNIEEAQEIMGFAVIVPDNIPEGYNLEGITVVTDEKVVKLQYKAGTGNNSRTAIILEGRPEEEFQVNPSSILSKSNGSDVEIQSPVQMGSGILDAGGAYAGITNISSIRWRQDGYEYAVVGDISMEELIEFANRMPGTNIEVPASTGVFPSKPQVEVPVDMEVERNTQESVDSGHTPWKLDPAFVAQVFIGQLIYPEGIVGEYPVGIDEIKISYNDGKAAIVQISGEKTPAKNVYLKKLIREDATGIWTVVGYDPADNHNTKS